MNECKGRRQSAVADRTDDLEPVSPAVGRGASVGDGLNDDFEEHEGLLIDDRLGRADPPEDAAYRRGGFAGSAECPEEPG